jgi:glycosyltransferase involved in cell wall biosynthesis
VGVDVSIVTSGHDVADARLHRIAAALLRRGLSVEVLGLGDAADGPVGTSVRTTSRGGLGRRPLTAVRYAAAAQGRVVLALDPDSLLAARGAALVRRRPVVADVHEDYAALLHDRRWAHGVVGLLAAALVAVATRAARTSALTVVADDHVPPLVAANRLVVRNLPDLRMLPEPSPTGPTPRALYIGDVRGSRGLWSMLDAVEAAQGWELDIVGPLSASDTALVGERLANGLGSRVRLHGRRPPQEAWTLAQGAWCGLVLLEDTPAFRDALPSKLYEYLGCGLPVVVSDLPRQAQLVRDAGVGAVVSAGPQAGARTGQVLAGWSASPDVLAPLRDAARRWSQEHREDDPYAVLADRIAGLAGR